MFEYWAFILPIRDYALHRGTMRRFPRGGNARARYVREWLKANATFRRYVLGELRRRGPLRSRQLEDRAQVPWRSGGWNDGKSLGRMLDTLWHRGEVAIAGRRGNERLWDLGSRVYPTHRPPLPSGEVARTISDRQLRVCGITRLGGFGFTFDGRPPGWKQALGALIRDGTAVPVEVNGTAGEWYAHRDVLDAPLIPRTTLLSPFDPLIVDRDRADELFGFHYRLEMYLPKHKRQFGYYVLPVLSGNRLVGRVDPQLDRRTRVLHVNAVYAESGATVEMATPLRSALDDLARWVGADSIELPSLDIPKWREAVRDVAGSGHPRRGRR